MFKWLLVIVFIFLLLPFSQSEFCYAQTELTVTIGVGDTVLTFSGKTSPGALVTLVENGAVVGTTIADNQGNFSKSLLAQTPGVHLIGIYATDENTLTTPTVNYSVSLTASVETTLSNIILPPTISLSTNALDKGNSLGISGLSVPVSTVTLFISSTTTTKTVSSGSDGSWSYSLNTGDLEQGDHSVYAKTTVTVGYQSESSTILSFKVNPAPTPTSGPETASTLVSTTAISPAVFLTSAVPTVTIVPTIPTIPAILAIFDIDRSGRIELSELFEAVKAWVTEWREKPLEEARCDLNGDGKCNLIDLSILLYYVGR